MRYLRTNVGIRLALVAALGAWALPIVAAGCTPATCEDECLDQYDDCLARAPPGASRDDCATQYDRCLDSCAASDE